MGYRVAVVGATGNVGREMLNILAEREFPASEVTALTARKGIGQELSFGDRTFLDVSLELGVRDGGWAWGASFFDAELDGVGETLADVLTNLALIQRDDTALKNGSVHANAFSSAALALVGGSRSTSSSASAPASSSRGRWT